MAQIWFIKSTYNGNTFKVSEFFNADGTYKKNVGSNLEVDMPFNDGISLIDAIHHKTTNGTHIRDYTHFIVPDKNKVYRINKIDELNHDTLRMEVEDQPWIAEYWNYKDKKMNITRTNEYNSDYYQGVNDIPVLSTDYQSEIINSKDKPSSGSKLWSLVFTEPYTRPYHKIQYKINLNTGQGVLPMNSEMFRTTSELYSKYPPIDITGKTESQVNDIIKNVWYYGKWIRLYENEMDQILEFSVKGNSITWNNINYNIYDIKKTIPEYTIPGYYEQNSEKNVSSGIELPYYTDAKWRVGDEFYLRDTTSPEKSGMYYIKEVKRNLLWGWYYNVWEKVSYSYVYFTEEPINPGNTGWKIWLTTYNKVTKKYWNNSVFVPEQQLHSGFEYEEKNTLYLNMEDSDKLNSEVRSLYPESPSTVLAFPFSSHLGTYKLGEKYSSEDDAAMIPASAFSGLEYRIVSESGGDWTEWTAVDIKSIKVIPEDLLFDKTSNISRDNINPDRESKFIYNYLNDVSIDSVTLYKVPVGYNSELTKKVPLSIGFIKLTDQISDISLDVSIEGIKDREPFINYELVIYGQSYEVPSKYVNSLHMIQTLSSSGLQYSIYRDSELTKLYISGSASLEAAWKESNFARWAAENPTYKDEYNLKKQIEWTNALTGTAQSTASGVITGVLTGRPTAAIASGVSGLVGGFSHLWGTRRKHEMDDKMYELQQSSLMMKAPKLYGDPSASSKLPHIRSSIYWVIKRNNNDDMMYNYYIRNGFPTTLYKAISEMNAQGGNPIFKDNEPIKVISGYFIDTIRNNYTTDSINETLTDGVIIIE